MPSLTLTFPQKINESLQIGDTIYYSNDGSNIIKMGNVTAPLSSTQIQATVDATLVLPTTNSFILFSKDNKANLSSLVGYYAEVEFTNDSTSAAELFTVSAEMVESSK
tara:strand:+ start:846 stop:1169 length:324 start_codon:yes stop_codon:yes gene_type:complete